MLFIPALQANLILSVKGKKASEAITEPFKILSLPTNFTLLDFSRAKLTESTLLVLPDPIPIVVLFLAMTIALDLTYLTTLLANIKSLISL